MSSISKIRRKINEISPDIKISEVRNCIVLEGEVDSWETVVKAGQAAVDKKHYLGVINNINLKNFTQHRILPEINDSELEGLKPDVLVIGGGITGCSIARELSKYNLNVILAEKGEDVAVGASRANGGVVHVGINFSRKSLKHYYNIRGNRMYAGLSEALDVPFEQEGQIMLCSKNWERLPVFLLRLNAKLLGIPGVKYLKREELKKYEPELPDFAIGGMYMPIGGITNPYEMTVAMAENAVSNGVRLSLNTVVTGMTVDDGKIKSVLTNRGRMYPRLVINAAGVYADEIAEMADDRTFTIHPRRGTNIITDKKAGYMVRSSMGKSPFSILPYQETDKPKGLKKRISFFLDTITSKSHTKGVGLIHSVHGNMLIGPNAVETPDRENTATDRTEVESIINMQQHIAADLKYSDVIAYFTGVRAATYEEDFVVRKGIFTKNILQAAGIQSPGITAAPAVAVDICKWAVDFFRGGTELKKEDQYSMSRKAKPKLSEISDEERDALIKKNPDYGIIVCRCEEVSRGEIIDALNSPLCVPTLDGIKRRLRPGMGRCQGGFCSPLITQIIAEHQGKKLSDVRKGSPGSAVTLGPVQERAE